jgi:hypothetical protein
MLVKARAFIAGGLTLVGSSAACACRSAIRIMCRSRLRAPAVTPSVVTALPATVALLASHIPGQRDTQADPMIPLTHHT